MSRCGNIDHFGHGHACAACEHWPLGQVEPVDAKECEPCKAGECRFVRVVVPKDQEDDWMICGEI